MKKNLIDAAQPAIRQTTVNFVSVIKVNKMLMAVMIFICIVATGILGFTFGEISGKESKSKVVETSKVMKLDNDIIAQDVICLEIEKIDSQKKNDALEKQSIAIEKETATLSDKILKALLDKFESKKVTNRSATVASYAKEASNMITLNNKLTVFKKTTEYKMIDLSSYENAITSRLARIPTLRPIPGTYGGYGWRIHPIFHYRQFHPAADVGAPEGTSIHAAASGYVVTASYGSSTGNYIVINHGNGFVTTYMHCRTLLVRVGQQVKKGEVIGKVGHTGTATAPHLHFEVTYNGSPFDPRKILV